mgnify:CR=1 FL=1|tara:strand:- start:29102 stop:30049 length:948 start_codon:yes stop_codon:yes gene_type:complete
MKKINFSIIGCGNIAGNYITKFKLNKKYTHANTLKSLADPLICVDANYKNLIKFQKKWRFKYRSKNLNIFKKCSNLIDILVISSPTKTHYKIIRRILDLNLNPKIIVCEKPFTNRYHDAKKILRECRKRKIKLITNYNRRWDSTTLKIQKKINKKIFGNFIHGNVIFSKGILNTSSHFIDLLFILFGYKNFEIGPVNHKKKFEIIYKKSKLKSKIFFIHRDKKKVSTSEIILYFDKKIVFSYDGGITWIEREYDMSTLFKKKVAKIYKYKSTISKTLPNLYKFIINILMSRQNSSKLNIYNNQDLKIHNFLKKVI